MSSSDRSDRRRGRQAVVVGAAETAGSGGDRNDLDGGAPAWRHRQSALSLASLDRVLPQGQGHQSRLRRSILLSAIDNYGGLILTLLLITILSRLLTPHEFGIYAITTSIPGVLSAVREFGGANYIIQKQDLSGRCIRTAFTINCAISAALIALLFAICNEMALFFDEDGIRVGIAVGALNFVFLPFAETVSALLRCEMAFHVIVVCNLLAAMATLITSISLAAAGFSFMGPVWGLVAGSAAQAILFCAYSRDPRLFLPCLND